MTTKGDTMNRPSLADIDKSAAAATEGPWDVIGGGEYVSGPDIVVAPDDGGVTPANTTFIAVARTAVPALSAAIRDVLALHTPTGNVTCGTRTDGAVPHRHYSGRTEERVMTCSNPAGHAGPHKDAVCCWAFHSFSDGVPGVGRDLRSCATCHTAYPCETVRVISAHIDTTPEEVS